MSDLPSGRDRPRACGTLSKSSTVLGDFSLKDGVGYHYRLRALYVRSKTDYANLNSDSPWIYFQVTT